MKGLILISTVAFSLASFAASASEAPSESVCSLTHLISGPPTFVKQWVTN